jgi:hypothetical protein
MAAIVVSETLSRWTGRTKDRAGYLRALEPNDEAARKDLETMVLGMPHFEVKGTTDTNTSASVALNLTAQGVTFPADTQRLLYVEAYVADDNGSGVVIGRALIRGGATPVVADEQLDVTLDDDLSAATSAPTLDFQVNTADVVIEAIGDADVDARWHIKVWVGELIPLAFIATT